jgi:FkbM family methyltransferase
MREDGQIQPAKVTHFTQQGFTLTGIIHAGMNDGEEVYSYKDLGIKNIIGFEPLPFAAQKARDEHGVYVSELALSDKTGVTELIVTKGDGKGSSIFEPILESEEVKKNWVDNGIIVDHIKIQTTRFDEWVEHQPKDKFDIANFNCLVLDTQGNEWEVLHGCGKYLQEFSFLSIELSSTPVYEGEHSAQEVCDWLAEQGFTQDSEIQSHNDVFFIKSSIKPTSDRIYYGLA